MNYNRVTILEPPGYFRAIGRLGLQGRIMPAFWVGVVYLLLLNVPQDLILEIMGFSVLQLNKWADMLAVGEMDPQVYLRKFSYMMSVILLYGLVAGGAFNLGMSALYLRYRRRLEGGIDLIFSGFGNYIRALGLICLQTLFVGLWSMLFVIPGFIAMYRYRLAFFILADNPEINPIEALRISKFLMQGNKGALFMLDLSFLGWFLLTFMASSSILTPFVPLSESTTGSLIYAVISGIVSSFAGGLLNVYKGISEAAFYERAANLLPVTGPPPIQLDQGPEGPQRPNLPRS